MVDLVDVGQKVVAAEGGDGGGEEVLGEGFPSFGEGREKGVDVLGEFALFWFVGFGEDDVEGDAVGAEEVNEVEVNFLWGYAGVDEYEDVDEGFAVEYVVGNHFLE